MEQDEIVQYIHQLIAEACCHSAGSLKRNKKLTEIMFLMQSSGKILRDSQLNQFDYEDVLSKTWLYFCRNLCEANTASRCFDPERANIFTWFNSYLSFRIRDRLKEIALENYQRIYPQSDPETGRLIDPITSIPDVSPTNSLIDKIRQWLESNQNTFARIHIRNNPEANVYTIILHHLIFDTSWQTLSQQLHESSPTLSNFYRRKCLPLLMQWMEEQEN